MIPLAQTQTANEKRRNINRERWFTLLLSRSFWGQFLNCVQHFRRYYVTVQLSTSDNDLQRASKFVSSVVVVTV